MLIQLVRDLVASDDATLNPILGLLEGANSDQAAAIGTALGQAALLAVKVDQAYATRIQDAMAKASPMPAQSSAGPKSAEPKIGSAVTTKDQVDGVTERGMHPIAAGTEVYSKEVVRTGSSGMAQFLFADHTNLSVGPVAEIRLDKFVYDPNAEIGQGGCDRQRRRVSFHHGPTTIAELCNSNTLRLSRYTRHGIHCIDQAQRRTDSIKQGQSDCHYDLK